MVKKSGGGRKGGKPGDLTHPLPEDYTGFLGEVKSRVAQAQARAALAVHRELLGVYWSIGQRIVGWQEAGRWGSSIVERLARDLSAAFPGIAGFSQRNLWRMRAFFLAYPPSPKFLPQAVAEMGTPELPQAVPDLPWGHQIVLLEKVKNPAERGWYARAAFEHGWPRTVLVHQIDSDLYQRQGKALTNFDRALPPSQSELARETLKDPYIFDFLSLGPDAQERDLEKSLITRLRDFLLELGSGFALVGSQYHLEIGGQDFYLDLLFYHLRLRCYVVIELKVGEFQPEHAGKMSFYLSAVDDLLRHPGDQPSIGLILCKTRSRLIAEYALHGVHRPIGVASYRLMPEALKESLPSPEELEKELGSLEEVMIPVLV